MIKENAINPKNQFAPAPVHVSSANNVSVIHWFYDLNSCDFHIPAEITQLIPNVDSRSLSWQDFLSLFDTEGQTWLSALVSEPSLQSQSFSRLLSWTLGEQSGVLGLSGQIFSTASRWVCFGILCDVVNSRFLISNHASSSWLWMQDYWFEQSKVPSWITDSHGCLLRINQAGMNLWKLDRAAVAKASGHYNLLEDAKFLRSGSAQLVLDSYRDGTPVTAQFDYDLRALGQSRSVNFNADFVPALNQHGHVAYVLVQHHSSSSEYSLPAYLRQQDQLLINIINNTNSIISVKDLTGHFLLVNNEFSRFTEMPLEKVCGLNALAIFPKYVARFSDWQDQQVIQSGCLVEHEEHIPARDNPSATFLNVRFPIRDSSNEVYAVGSVMTDISARKLSEGVIEKQRNELQLLLDSVNVCVWYLDRWGRVQTANKYACDIVPFEQCYGKNPLEFMHFWNAVEECQREIMQVIRTGVPLLNAIEYYVAPEVGERWFSVDKIPTKDIDGVVSGVLLVASDITERINTEKALREAETRYKAFIANSTDGIWRYDLDPPVPVHMPLQDQRQAIVKNAKLAECNRVFAKMCQAMSMEDLVNASLISTGSQSFFQEVTRFITNGYRLVDCEKKIKEGSGEVTYLSVCATGTIEDGKLLRVWGTSQDVTRSRHYLEMLEYQATHDSLTLLPNRKKLYSCVEDILLTLKSDRKAALLLIDLDRFKEINDTLGHYAGDDVLKQIGLRLESELQGFNGMVARLGGDEFAIFISDILHVQKAMIFAHRILDAISQPFELEGIHTEISASIGIAIAPDQASDVSTLLRYADVAMYRAKNGMSRVGIYKATEDPHTAKRLTLLNELRKAIRENELIVYFQPKIDLVKAKVFGVEALLRWNHPRLGFVSPGEFIPLAEKTDLIEPLTYWVLRESLAACQSWLAQGRELRVAVNLSTRNLMADGVTERIKGLLLEFGIAPRFLELEITESAIMTDPQRALSVLQEINSLGISISIDDFGTGYSSLSYLKKLPVASLKIDNSFVIGMLEDEQDQIIVNSTIHLAHNLSLQVVAEGVESREVLDCLADLGCDHAQGYFIGRPMPKADLEKWLQESEW